MPNRCVIHDKVLPCKACAGKLGGMVSSEKKSRANRSKCKLAAYARWYGKEAADRILKERDAGTE